MSGNPNDGPNRERGNEESNASGSGGQWGDERGDRDGNHGPADQRSGGTDGPGGRQPAGGIGGGGTPGGTATGLDANVAGALSYVLGWITGLVFYLVEDDEFVRFHALLSILLNVAFVAVWIALSVFGVVLGFLRLGVIAGLLWSLVSLAGLGIWAFSIYKAYNHEWLEYPVIGPIARRTAARASSGGQSRQHGPSAGAGPGPGRGGRSGGNQGGGAGDGGERGP